MCHFSLWFGLVFAAPLFIVLNNREAVFIPLPRIVLTCAVATLLLTVLGWAFARLLKPTVRKRVCIVLVSFAILLAIQGNIVSDLFFYGTFNGEIVDFRAYGWMFWAEWFAWLCVFPLLLLLISRSTGFLAWWAMAPVLSFVLLLAPSVLSSSGQNVYLESESSVNPAVFAFSTRGNFIHLLPDGFQSDVVQQVLEEDAALAARFEGFTLFADHVGLHQGTGPSLYTILTGKPYPFGKTFSYDWLEPDIQEFAYTVQLEKENYRQDFVPFSYYVCGRYADSCHVRTFGDLKSRGYFQHREESALYSVRLVADLTLFRLVPMYLKEKLYAQGRWFIADTRLNGTSPWPDPVIREWTERMFLIEDRPVYKWYHYIGTHIPARWDENCQLMEEPGVERAHYLGQARCLLEGIASLMDRLEQAGIYDQTSVLISGDHGHNTAPSDLAGDHLNSAMTSTLLGSARPVFMAKRRNDRSPLKISSAPTSLLDIAPTALALSGVPGEAGSAFGIAEDEARVRHFRPYSIPEFFSDRGPPYVEYQVGQPASDASNWAVAGIERLDEPPLEYDPVNLETGQDFILGARLGSGEDGNASWISGRQLAFVIKLDGLPRKRMLELTVHVPEWISGQTMSVHLNNGPAIQETELRSGEPFWQVVQTPLAPVDQLEGANFVSLRFDKSASPPGVTDWKGSAFIRSIRVIETASPD